MTDNIRGGYMHKYLVQVSAIDRCVWKSLRLCHRSREAGGPGLRCSLRPERWSRRLPFLLRLGLGLGLGKS